MPDEPSQTQSLTETSIKEDSATNKKVNEAKIISVLDLIRNEKLAIPEYQRPYKWTTKHVNQLIDDILLFQKKPAYRLGTLVLHKEKECDILNIVDGQQRAITLSLIAHAMVSKQSDLVKKISKNGTTDKYQSQLLQRPINSDISIYNLQTNYLEIERRISEFSKDSVRFFFERCQLVQVTLTDISEAFQFFDSQNSRGKDLEPHDLLKAFHLRAMDESSTEQEKMEVVSKWEEIETGKLADLFGLYLYRIRRWSKENSGRYFTKDDVGTFKGISLTESQHFPYAQVHHVVDRFIEGYNKHQHRAVDHQQMSYPFQLDQVLINGKRFFEMVPFYKRLLWQMHKRDKNAKYFFLNEDQDGTAIKILKTLNEYDGAYRTGDRYVRNLFDCCCLYYLNKFGPLYFGKATEKIFVWAYSLRLEKKAVQLAAVDNHALGGVNMFKKIREAVHPIEILNLPLPYIKERQSTKTQGIEEVFRELNYLN